MKQSQIPNGFDLWGRKYLRERWARVRNLLNGLVIGLMLCSIITGAWDGDVAVASELARVVVDPAHGGRDTGVRLSEGVYEKDITLILARAVREEARSIKGLQVRLTRERDETLSWAKRRGAGRRADLWISLHVNADFKGRAQGARVFYSGTAIEKMPKGAFADSQTDVKAILQDMAQTKRTNESVLLAEHLQRALESVWGDESHTCRPAPLFGLRDLENPAVLLEVGFLTNGADRMGLGDAKRRRKIVGAILKGIRSFVQDPRRAQ